LQRLVRIVCRFLFVVVRNWPASYCKPFPFGGYLRNTLAHGILEQCGTGINIERGARFGNGTGIRLGDYSGIGIRAEVGEGTTIGRYVMMGPEVVIITGSHEYSDVTKPMALQGREPIRPVVIEDDVWIGLRVIILPGVVIGTGSIIGAGAIVTKSIPPYSIAVGNPARVVRNRLPGDDPFTP
jgi:maltose O-acetyltransferase